MSDEGENLGKLQDLVINVRSGQIESALVSKGFMVRQGSVAGLGEILMPVPWQAIAVGTERRFVLNVDQDKAATDPTAEPGSRQPGFAVHIFGFIQAAPDSAMGGGDEEVESGSGGERGGPIEDGRPLPKEL